MELTLASSSFILSVILILLILVCHIYLHLKKNGKEFIIIRTLFLLIGLVGLFLLFARPTIKETIPIKNIILATSNSAKVVPQKGLNLKTVNSIHELLNAEASYDTVIISGDGLSESSLSLLDSFQLKFHPSVKIKGFTAINIPIAKEKEPWSLSGTINQAQAQKVNLKLSDGQLLETTPDENGNFLFTTVAGSAGHFTYEISAQYPDTTITETIPIEILPSQKWNLLALSSSPTFELNYLKNYWVKLGNGFTLKQKVSNDRYKETFLNNPKIALDKINNQVLNKFNFLLIDTKSWNDLKETEQSLILNYVTAGRVGLLFIGIEKGDTVEKLANLKIDSEQEIVVENSNTKITQSKISKGYRSLRFNKFMPAAIRNYGLGTIAVMTIPETYRFLLADDNTSYQNIWAKIFSELYIAPSEEVIFKSPTWNWENEDVNINIYANKNIEEQASLNSAIQVPIYETKDQIGMYAATVRSNAGWNRLSINADKYVHRFYTHPSNSWHAIKQSHLHSINHTAAKAQRAISKRENHTSKELPFYWGLIISLIGFGGLWMHERIYT